MVFRILELGIGITMMSFGVALTILSTLGTTPISALPTVLSPITGLTVGGLTLIFNFFYVFSQILLLRRRYRWIQLLQLVTGALFGVMIDVCGFLVAPLATSVYWQQWVLALAGILAMGLGIGIQVRANVINLPGEGFVLALTAEARRIFGARDFIHFGNMKIINDLTHVAISAILGLVFLGMLVGVREATIVSAFALGWISKAYLNRFPAHPSIRR